MAHQIVRKERQCDLGVRHSQQPTHSASATTVRRVPSATLKREYNFVEVCCGVRHGGNRGASTSDKCPAVIDTLRAERQHKAGWYGVPKTTTRNESCTWAEGKISPMSETTLEQVDDSGGISF